MDDTITPKKMFAMVARAIAADLRADIIIVGSLAASYRSRRSRREMKLGIQAIEELVGEGGKRTSHLINLSS